MTYTLHWGDGALVLAIGALVIFFFALLDRVAGHWTRPPEPPPFHYADSRPPPAPPMRYRPPHVEVGAGFYRGIPTAIAGEHAVEVIDHLGMTPQARQVAEAELDERGFIFIRARGAYLVGGDPRLPARQPDFDRGGLGQIEWVPYEEVIGDTKQIEP